MTKTKMKKLRLRLKVYTDEKGERFLAPTGFYHVATDVVKTIALRDEFHTVVSLSREEWNALPFAWFEETGLAPASNLKLLDEDDKESA